MYKQEREGLFDDNPIQNNDRNNNRNKDRNNDRNNINDNINEYTGIKGGNFGGIEKTNWGNDPIAKRNQKYIDNESELINNIPHDDDNNKYKGV